MAFSGLEMPQDYFQLINPSKEQRQRINYSNAEALPNGWLQRLIRLKKVQSPMVSHHSRLWDKILSFHHPEFGCRSCLCCCLVAQNLKGEPTRRGSCGPKSFESTGFPKRLGISRMRCCVTWSITSLSLRQTLVRAYCDLIFALFTFLRKDVSARLSLLVPS